MEENKLHTLRLIGFSGHEIENFFAIFYLAERRLKQHWKIVETDSADFFLLTEKSQIDQSSYLRSLPPERFLLCSSAEIAPDSNSVLVDSNRTPKLSSLILLLNRIGGQIFEEVPVALTVKDIREPQIKIESEPDQPGVVFDNKLEARLDDDVFFNPQQGLLKHLLQAQAQPSCVVFTLKSHTDCNKIYLHSAEKNYFCQTSLKNLIPYLNAGIELLVEPVSEAKLIAEVEKATLTSKPLSNLIWFVGFQLSQGRLLQGHSDQDTVSLTRWPDLTVHGCEKFVKLAAFMKNNAVSLDTLASETGFSLAQIHDFYNACYLIGLIEKSVKTETHKKASSNDTQSLLRKISNRLNKISNPDFND